MSTDIRMTAKEFEMYSKEENILSDIDYALNRETGEYDVPAIEWDGPWGKHWTKYDSESDRSLALMNYKERIMEWLTEHRELVKRDAIARGRRIAAERKALREARTLGGNFPILKELLLKARV